MAFLGGLFGSNFPKLLARAIQLGSRGDWEDARLDLQKALSGKLEGIVPSEIQRAKDLLGRALREMVKRRESEAEALAEAGESQSAAERMDLASELAADPMEKERLTARARVLREQRESAERPEATRAPADEVLETETMEGVGTLLEDRGDPDTMFNHFGETVEELGLRFRTQAHPTAETALAWESSAKAGTASADDYYDLAQAYRLYAMDASAAFALDEALRRNPADAEARMQLVGLLVAAVKEVMQASASQSRLAQVGATGKTQKLLDAIQGQLSEIRATGQMGATGLAFEALASLWLGTDASALLPQLEEAWRADPGGLELAEALSECYVAAGNAEGAVSVLREAVQRHRDAPDLLFRWAELEEQRGNAAQAAELRRQAEAMGPEGGLGAVLRHRSGLPVE